MPLSPKQRRFVQEYLVDGNAAGAARRAGYSASSARVNGPRLLSNAVVQEALHVSQQADADRLRLGRQRVLEGLLEGVQVARGNADPNALIRAWAEIGKLMGYYAPERKTLEVSASAKRVISQLEGLSDEELLALAEGATGVPPAPPV